MGTGIEKIWALYYSASGTTDRAVNTLAEALAAELDLPLERLPFTRPAERARDHAFGAADLVVAGCPTYAGRMPNKIAPDFRARLRGNGALAVPVVLFGNRSYDNALAELRAVLASDGFRCIAAGAFVGRHAFTDRLGTDRPDWDDKKQLRAFAGRIAEKVRGGEWTEVRVPGEPDAPYYIPRGLDGQPVNFLKAKPKTDLGKCCNCGVCARACPMGAIDPKNVALVPGTCIKCHACVRKCTHHAKFFDDPAFLSHVGMLEREFGEARENRIFL